MKYFWSGEIDSILSAGRSLEDVGICNWALNRKDALVALVKLLEMGVAVLGGDVYSVKGEFVDLSYDNWYCDKNLDESDSAFVERSNTVARNYITSYRALECSVLFAIVPKSNRSD